MKKTFFSFVPRNDGELAVWAVNLKEKIVIWGPILGYSAAQVSQIQDYCQFIIDAVNKVEAKRGELSNAVNAKNEMRENELQLVVNSLLALKKHPAYLPSIGGELRIIGSVQVLNPEYLKPILSAEVHAGKVTLAFNLQKMNCVSVYCRPKGTMGWEKLGNDYESPYEDKRPLAVANQPEIREYMVRYFNGREEIGKPSDIVTVTYGG
ncbi:hypothetical protein SAMN05421788_1011248 [Filimonas lacunae]|uniref:Uncharacterized protein n=1 Tax=Filimonas lacunae TaxID=477680 RepID=A0A173MQ57_9BACT|nr:hypothetical protein [Filimonas lacunae]BAV09815.1 hypothetical protein FLA_5868 [Filimonas lacunae]SIS79372.1 hypothetical protein SAMN05421788_1011248 [Filimonas lacunae]